MYLSTRPRKRRSATRETACLSRPTKQTPIQLQLHHSTQRSELYHGHRTRVNSSSFFSPSIHIHSISLCRCFMAYPCCTLALSAPTAGLRFVGSKRGRLVLPKRGTRRLPIHAHRRPRSLRNSCRLLFSRFMHPTFSGGSRVCCLRPPTRSRSTATQTHSITRNIACTPVMGQQYALIFISLHNRQSAGCTGTQGGDLLPG